MDLLQPFAPWISIAVASVAAFLVWGQWRERQLRKDDVLRWSNDVIRALQSLYLYTSMHSLVFDADSVRPAIMQLAVDTSVLVEQGRLFFRNAQDPEHGKQKMPAYRGHRPELLDPIVVAHQVACRWDKADADSRQRMAVVVGDCAQRFVSLAQMEVGRSRTANWETAKGGRGDTLDELVAQVDPARLR